jgi:serine/threonine protein kinase
MDKRIKSAEGEVQSLGKLIHENIIELLGVATNEGSPCIILEYAENDSLHHALHG